MLLRRRPRRQSVEEIRAEDRALSPIRVPHCWADQHTMACVHLAHYNERLDLWETKDREGLAPPHAFFPLRRRDRKHKKGLCKACYWPKDEHNTPSLEWTPARLPGDKRSSWQRLYDLEHGFGRRFPVLERGAR